MLTCLRNCCFNGRVLYGGPGVQTRSKRVKKVMMNKVIHADLNCH